MSTTPGGGGRVQRVSRLPMSSRSTRRAHRRYTAVEDRPTAAVPRFALTPTEAAAALGMGLTSFKKYVQPQLRIVRRGKLRVIPVGEVERGLRRMRSASSMALSKAGPGVHGSLDDHRDVRPLRTWTQSWRAATRPVGQWWANEPLFRRRETTRGDPRNRLIKQCFA
jgi:hypothetical protein